MFLRIIISFIFLLVFSARCFCQSEQLRFIIDTASTNDEIYDSEYDYYDKQIIRCRTFYNCAIYCNYSKAPVHFEYIRITDKKYYCIEYDSVGNRISEGLVKRDTKPFDALIVPVFDSSGKIIDNKKIVDYYKFHKAEFWTENIDSAWYYNHDSGKYRNGKKDGIWIKLQRGNVERELLYEAGKVINDETVNITGKNERMIADVLIGRWQVLNQSFSTLSIKMEPDPYKKEKYCYIIFKKNGTYKQHFNHYQPDENGKWKLISNANIINLMPEKINAAMQNLKINYISKYGLNVTFTY